MFLLIQDKCIFFFSKNHPNIYCMPTSSALWLKFCSENTKQKMFLLTQDKCIFFPKESSKHTVSSALQLKFCSENTETLPQIHQQFYFQNLTLHYSSTRTKTEGDGGACVEWVPGTWQRSYKTMTKKNLFLWQRVNRLIRMLKKKTANIDLEKRKTERRTKKTFNHDHFRQSDTIIHYRD